MEVQNLAKFAFYHSAERVVGSGAILHRGPKSPFFSQPGACSTFFRGRRSALKLVRRFFHSAERVVSRGRDTAL